MTIHFGGSENGTTTLKAFIRSMTNQYLNTAETHIVDFRKPENMRKLSFSSTNGGHPFTDMDQDLLVAGYKREAVPSHNNPLTPHGLSSLGSFLNELQLAAIDGFIPKIDYLPTHKMAKSGWNAVMVNDIPAYLTVVKQPQDVSVTTGQPFTIKAICDRPEANWEVLKAGTAVAVATGRGTTATYTVAASTADHAGQYSVKFTEDALTATSKTVTVTVQAIAKTAFDEGFDQGFGA